MALRLVVAGYDDLSGMELQRSRCPRCGDDHGQPRLVAPWQPGVSVTTSASGELALCGVSRLRRLGVDVEPLANASLLEGVSGLILTDNERRRIDAGHVADRQAALLKLWTLKEAYLKAGGVGLSRDPRDVDTTTLVSGYHPDAATCVRSAHLQATWRAITSVIGKTHILSIVWHGPCVDIRLRTLPGFGPLPTDDASLEPADG